jgi:hypothetical protein
MVSRHFITAAVVAIATSASLTLTGTGAARAATPAWHTAIAAPGAAALNAGGDGSGTKIACPSAGNCSADGLYRDKSSHLQAFVIGEKNGAWGKAIEVPGLGALNAGGHANIRPMSCVSAGNCAAGGSYADANKIAQAYVVNEVNGVWHNAIEVPGFTSLNLAWPDAGVDKISCRSAGDCSAGGSYQTSTGAHQVFVVNEVDGVWGNAIEVPGIASLVGSGSVKFGDLSCASAGNCEVVVGTYGTHGFVASEVNGVWQNAAELPGKLPETSPSDISCPSEGNCSVIGTYARGNGVQIFTASEVNGVWNAAAPLPGLASLNTNNRASLESMSCFSAGNCVISGNYLNYSDQHGPLFVAHEVNGTWHDAFRMPVDADLSPLAVLTAGACASAQNCSFGGYDASPTFVTFVIDEVHGVWQPPVEMPGLRAIDTGYGAAISAIACASAGNCGAIGWYATTNSQFPTQVFVDSES